MAKVGKKYAEAAKLFDKQKQYDVAEAIDILKKMDTAKFDETVELSVNLNVDPKYADQQVRGALVLPHGTGKSKTVLVFAQGDKEKEALAAGADFVGADDLVEKIQGGWLVKSVVSVKSSVLKASCLTRRLVLLRWTLKKLLAKAKLVRLNIVRIRPAIFTPLSAKSLSMQIN